MTESFTSEFEESYEDHHELRGEIFSTTLGDVPVRELFTVPDTMSADGAIRAMNGAGQGCALVVRDGKLVGIFTERDVLRRVVLRDKNLNDVLVGEVMTSDPDTLPRTATVAYALKKMSGQGYRHIPLLDDAGHPTGVVAVRDIVAWMVDLFPESVLNLPPKPGFPKTADGG